MTQFRCQNCPHCSSLGPKQRPSSAGRTLRKFGQACRSLYRVVARKSNEAQPAPPQELANDFKVAVELDGFRLPVEIGGGQVFEMDGTEEIHGLLAGVHYLDNVVDQKGKDLDIDSWPLSGSSFLGICLSEPEEITYERTSEPASKYSSCDNPYAPVEMECFELPTPWNSYLNNPTWLPNGNADEIPRPTYPAGDRSPRVNSRKHPQERKGKERAERPRALAEMPNDNQWKTLWIFRSELRELYDKLMTAAQDPHCPGGRKTQRTFKSATQLLEVGLVAFQEVLLGRAPTTLQKVLGFVCASYLMWTAVKRHKATEIRDPLQELSIWRSVIKMENDRHTFDFLTHSLWPSAPTCWASVPGQSAGESDVVSSISDASTLHEVDYYSLTSAFGDTSVLGNHMALSPTWDSGGLDTAYSHVDLDNLKSFPTLGDFQVYVDQLLSETASNDDLRFADFLNIPDLHENLTSRNRARAETDRTPPWQHVDVSPATSASNIQLVSSLDPWASPELSEPFISPQVLEEFLPPVKGPSAIEPVRSLREDAGSCNPPEGCAHYDTTQTILSILVGSLLIRAVLDFFRFLSQASGLLAVFSGCVHSRNGAGETIPPQYAPTAPVGEFLAGSSRLIFEPLRAALSTTRELAGIIAAAETLVRLGWIRSVREIEEYITHIAEHIVSSKSSFLRLLTMTLHQCMVCSADMTWDLVYSEGVVEPQEYSGQYLTSRESEGLRWASKHFPDSDLRADESSRHDRGRRLEARSADAMSSSCSDSPRKLIGASPEQGGLARRVAGCSHPGCSKVYKGRDAHINLRRHVRCAHEGKAWRCPYCELCTGRRDNLRQHFAKKHPGMAPPDWLVRKKRSAVCDAS